MATTSEDGAGVTIALEGPGVGVGVGITIMLLNSGGQRPSQPLIRSGQQHPWPSAST